MPTVRAEVRLDLADPRRMTLSRSALDPGAYMLRRTMRDAEGEQCSESAQPVTTHAAPLY